MREWEDRTWKREPARLAASDTFNKVQLPGTQLVQAISAAESVRKCRFFESGEGRLKDAQAKVTGVSHSPFGDVTIFGKPSAEVHGLLHEAISVKASLAGVRSMLHSKADRHAAHWRAYCDQRNAAEQLLHDWVALVSRRCTQALINNLAAIDGDMSVLDRSRIKLMDEASLLMVWDSVAQRLPERTAVVDKLHAELQQGEGDRRRVMDALLVELARQLLDVAHVSDGETERTVEQEALALNRSMLANRRAYATLISRLHEAQVHLEVSRRADYDAAVVDWRTLRTQHAVDLYNERIQSAEFAEPPERMERFGALQQAQRAHHRALLQHLGSIADLSPPNMDLKQSQRYQAQATRLCAAWDATVNEHMQGLRDHELRVASEAEQLYEALRSECQSYQGYSDGDLEVLLAERSGTVKSTRLERAQLLLEHTTAFLRGQAAEWTFVAKQLGTFAAAVAQEHEQQAADLKLMEKSVRKALKAVKAAFDASDEGREVALRAAMTRIAQAHSEANLDECVAEALTRLEAIEEGYRALNAESNSLAQVHPGAIQRSHDEYHVRLCEMLRLEPKVSLDGGDGGRLATDMTCTTTTTTTRDGAGGLVAPAIASKAADGDARLPHVGTLEQRQGSAELAHGTSGHHASHPARAVKSGKRKTKVQTRPVTPPPPMLSTADGTGWRILADLYEAITARPSPVVEDPSPDTTAAAVVGPPVTAAKVTDERTGAKSKGSKTAPAEPGPVNQPSPPPPPPAFNPTEPPQSTSGVQLCAHLSIAASDIRRSLAALSIGLLTDMTSRMDESVGAAKRWAGMSKIAFTEQLDEQLRTFRPRAGQIEEDARQARSVQLLGQRRTVDGFIRAQSKAVKSQVEEFDVAKGRTAASLQSMLDKLSHFQQLLYQCQSCKLLEIRKREAEKLAKKTIARINADCDRLKDSTTASCDCIAGANRRFEAATLHSFDEGGAFATENIEAYKLRIKEIDDHVDRIKAQEHAMADRLRELRSAACDSALELVLSQLPAHREDVALLEALDACIHNARRSTATMLESNRDAAAAINADIKRLGELVNKHDRHEGLSGARLYGEILQDVDALRLKLLPRARALGCLASTVMTPKQIRLPVRAAGTPLADDFGDEDVPPAGKDAKGKKAKDDKGRAEKTKASGQDDPNPNNTMVDAQPIAEKVAKTLAQVRLHIKTDTDGYYRKRDPARAITRPKQIPAKQDELVNATMLELSSLERTTQEHVTASIKEFRAQVVLSARELLCVPSAALSALLEHEVAYIAQAVGHKLEAHRVQHAVYNSQRVSHQQALRPGLSHPTQRDVLQALADAEAARQASSVALTQDLGRELRGKLPGACSRAEKRLGCALRQLNELLEACPLPDDLTAAPPGDDSLAGIQVKNQLQLLRLDLAMHDAKGSVVAPSAKGSGERPFGRRTVELPTGAITAADMDWSDECCQAFPPETLDAGNKDSAAGSTPSSISVIDTPMHRTLVRAHRAVIQKLAEAGKSSMLQATAELQRMLNEATVWEKTWATMLARIDIHRPKI